MYIEAFINKIYRKEYEQQLQTDLRTESHIKKTESKQKEVTMIFE